MGLESPRPQYRQLADLIRGAIDRGEYAPGSLLPSEDELARRYDVSRPTVNRAMSILRSEGLIRVERGRGTIVRDLPLIRRDAVARQRIRGTADARGAFQAELERLGLTARSDVQVSEAEPAADIAELLAVKQGTKVLTRHRKMYANDVPLQLAVSYLPLDIASGTALAEADTGPGGTSHGWRSWPTPPPLSKSRSASGRPMTMKPNSCGWKPSSGCLRCAGLPAVRQAEWWKSPTSCSPRTSGNWSTNGRSKPPSDRHPRARETDGGKGAGEGEAPS